MKKLKLKLKTETLRRLVNSELAGVQGGAMWGNGGSGCTSQLTPKQGSCSTNEDTDCNSCTCTDLGCPQW